MKETNLYEPVKALLESQGFMVRAEVKNIDVLASKGDILLAVELKTKMSMKLIYQAIDRQKAMDQTYIAIPRESIKKRGSSYKNLIYLLRRLELGLIIVENNKAYVEVEAKPYDMEKSRARYKKRKKQLVEELTLRKFHKNVGGTKGANMTLYKEQVIEIASYLLEVGNASPKQIKDATHIDKTASILQKNYDGYFKRITRGIYTINQSKRNQIDAYIKKIKNET